jgi:hypothetical protein
MTHDITDASGGIASVPDEKKETAPLARSLAGDQTS